MSMNLGKSSLLGQDHDHQMNAKSIEIIDVENYNCTYNSIVEIVNCEAEGNDSLNVHNQKTAEGFVPPPPRNVPMDSREYQRYLKAPLHFECAALASSQDKNKGLGVSRKPGDPSQETLLKESDKVEAAAYSAQQSKRRLVNRDSAQRTRKRKAERISELEARVSKLEEENSNLLKQRVDDLQRHNQTLRDNALIKQQVAELRSKVYVLEEKLKNVPSQHMSPALNCNMACGSAQDNVLIRQYPSQANTLLSGHDRCQSSMTCPLIPNSNNINDVNTSSSGHDHPQSSLANQPITNRNLDILDNDLDAWLKTANTLLSGHDRHQSSMTCPLIPNSNINDVITSSGHNHRQSSLANPPIADRDIDNDLDAWLKAQRHNPN